MLAARGNSCRLLGLHAVLLLVTVAPILSVDIPALGDYPNHLARLHILANLERSAALRENYQIVPTITPYLLVDWLLTPLVRVWGAYEVGRAFVAATMILTYSGALAITVALFRRLTLWPTLVLPLLYNHALSWGMMNYNFGIAVLFWAFAAWLWLRHRRAPIRMGLLLALSAQLYLVHMLAFGLFVALVCSHGLSVAHGRSRYSRAAYAAELLPMIPPFALTFAVYAVWFASEGVSGPKVTEFGSPSEKLAALVSPTMFTNSLADWLLLALYVSGAFLMVARRKLVLAPHMGFSLACLAALCLVTPTTLFGVWGVDLRLPPVLLMLTVSATVPNALPEIGRRPARAAALVALVLFRATTVWSELRLADREFEAFRAASGEIAEGARVLVAHDFGEGRLGLPIRAYLHLPLVAVIERNAFLPQLFTGVTQVRPAARNAEIDAGVSATLTTQAVIAGLDPAFIAANRSRVIDAYDRIYWAEWDQHFDYLIRINPAPMDDRIAARLESVSRYSFFEIARIRRAS